MKPSEYITSQATGTPLPTIGQWQVHLDLLLERLRPHFARPQPYHHTRLYLQAVFSEIPCKKGWQIAEQAKLARPYGMRLLSRAIWDQEGVRDELRTFVCQTLSPPSLLQAYVSHESIFPVLVLDESGFPKRGHHSAGVAPQYCGRTGRVERRAARLPPISLTIRAVMLDCWDFLR